MGSEAYCKNCGIAIDLEIDNPLCLCDTCYEDREEDMPTHKAGQSVTQ